MYGNVKMENTRMEIDNSKEGETIEMKVRRVVNNKEPIKDGAPRVYFPRNEGVKAATNIRTDRWEIALEATDKIAKSYKARREEKGVTAENRKEEAGLAESIRGKSGADTTKQ